MRTIRWQLAAVLLLALVREAASAGPEIMVGVTCDATQVGTGAMVTVPITFRAGTDDGGQANKVSAVDMTVTFASDAFTVSDVRLPAALAGNTWTLDWERTLGLPETAGRVGVSLAPAFQLPVPTLPDGPIVELVLTAVTHNQCVPIAIAPDSLVLSSPPIGLALAAGPITNGGVAITELCENCTDDDGDGLVDFADSDCGAASITSATAKVLRKKNIVKVRGTLPKALDATDPVRIALRPDPVTQAACAAPLESQITRCTGKKKKHCAFGQGKLIVDAKTGHTTLVATLSGMTPPEDATAVSLSVSAGTARFYASLHAQKASKKTQTYK